MLTIRRKSPGTVKGFVREIAAIREIRVAAEDPDAFQVAITTAMPHRAGRARVILEESHKPAWGP
ncbi:MAG TPA: hypothetical protein VF383_01790 [Candidatus Dormibacteraeota bacterium]